MKLKKLAIILIAFALNSCAKHEKSSEENNKVENQIKKDTIISYCEPNYDSYLFDTVFIHTTFHMKTFCLNDSAVYKEIFTDSRKENKNLVELEVGHNYQTDFIIKPLNSNKIELNITKKTFKNRLPADFYKVCIMWKNEFSHIENKQLIFRATLAEHDSDYQFAIQYSINGNGEIKIIKVDDESYIGGEDE